MSVLSVFFRHTVLLFLIVFAAGETLAIEPTLDGFSLRPTGGFLLASYSGGYVLGFDSTGKLDPTFGDRGVYHLPPESRRTISRKLLEGPNKTLYVVELGLDRPGRGETKLEIFATRFLPDGKPDETFGEKGRSTTRFARSLAGFLESVAVNAGGELAVAFRSDGFDEAIFEMMITDIMTGDAPLPHVSDLALDGLYVQIFRADGELKNEFGNRGLAKVPESTAGHIEIKLTNDGKVIVATGDEGFTKLPKKGKKRSFSTIDAAGKPESLLENKFDFASGGKLVPLAVTGARNAFYFAAETELGIAVARDSASSKLRVSQLDVPTGQVPIPTEFTYFARIAVGPDTLYTVGQDPKDASCLVIISWDKRALQPRSTFRYPGAIGPAGGQCALYRDRIAR